MKNYYYNDILTSLRKLKIRKNDKLFIHSNLTLFGNCKDIRNIYDIPKIWSKAIINSVGNDATIIFPLFTLSSCKKKIFDPIKSQSNSGVLGEFFLKNYKVARTNDPIYSFGILGKDKNKIKKNIDTNNSFSKNSIFSYIKKQNFKIICLNHVGTTFLHFIERELKVDYRFDKEFEGKIKLKNKLKKTFTKIFVSYKSDKHINHSPEQFAIDAKKQKIVTSLKLGSGDISIMLAKNVFNFVKMKIKSNHYYLTEASNIKNFKPNIIKEKIIQTFD